MVGSSSAGSGQPAVLGRSACSGQTERQRESASSSLPQQQLPQQQTPQLQQRSAHTIYFKNEDAVTKAAFNLHNESKVSAFRGFVQSIRVVDGLKITNYMSMATHALLGKPIAHARHRLWKYACTRRAKTGKPALAYCDATEVLSCPKMLASVEAWYASSTAIQDMMGIDVDKHITNPIKFHNEIARAYKVRRNPEGSH